MESVDGDEELYWKTYPDPWEEYDNDSYDLGAVFAQEEEPSLDLDDY